MTFARRVILLEFNELTPRVMARFIADGHLPNFRRLFNGSCRFVTDAEEQPPNLEPWIQWVTVHAGLRFSEHGVFHLGDAYRSDADSLWDVVSEHGGRVWVCGSMNAAHRPGLNGWFLPDPWSVSVRPNTNELLPYFDFVRSQVMEYTRANSRVGIQEALKFLRFMIAHGLSGRTIAAVCAQLAEERFRTARWKRVAILDRLQFDLFRFGYRKLKPALSTFFLNSTAHLQHVYWRNMEPESFSVKPGEQEQSRYANAVLYGYRQMDRLIGEVFDLVGKDDVAIVLATALGQQPCTIYDDRGGKSFYKPEDFRALLAAIGIDPQTCSVEPVMSEEFHIRFRTDEAADAAVKVLESVEVANRKVFAIKRSGATLLAGCAIFQELPPDSVMQTANGDHPFSKLFYFVDTKKSGMHHPDGLLWVHLPSSTQGVTAGTVPLVDVAPTILSLLGVQPSRTMTGCTLMDTNGQLTTAPRRAAA